MLAARSITIVGGGLAGLTLGIGLRQKNIPVTIWEAGFYPRHRVCGEFISGGGEAALTRLGLQNLIENAGAIRANTAAFFTGTKATSSRTLPASAICLSRFNLDQTLAGHFCQLGGELIVGRRWREDKFPEGVVRASGRRVRAIENNARWFGLKVHARNVSLTADLEMHFSSSGYVGLCKIGDGVVNICGLFRRDPKANPSSENLRKLLRGQPGSILNQRLAAAEFDEASFCAIAGLFLKPERAVQRSEICIGDAVTMIPPVSGNGMSMAFESAEIAVLPLAAWSQGDISWAEARDQIATVCDATFARRLAWAKWLQRFMLMPAWQSPLIGLIARNDYLWNTAFNRTR